MNPQPPLRKPVVDFDGLPVGYVRSVIRDSKTGDPESLLVRLAPEAKAALGVGSFLLKVPMREVGSLRQDEIVLARALSELAREGALREAPDALA